MKQLFLILLSALTFAQKNFACTQPAAPIANDIYMCESSQIPSLYSSNSLTEWYSDANLTNLLSTGYIYTPEQSTITNQNVSYYLVVRDGSCVSNVTTVTLHVIPKPVFTIGQDVNYCIYSDWESDKITAKYFAPSFSTGNQIEWYVMNSSNELIYSNQDNVLELTLGDFISTPGTYKVSAIYKSLFDESKYCISNEPSINVNIEDYASSPTFTQINYNQDGQPISIEANGTQEIMWKCDNIIPITYMGNTYTFSEPLSYGSYIFEFVDIDPKTGCKSETSKYQLEYWGVGIDEVNSERYFIYTNDNTIEIRLDDISKINIYDIKGSCVKVLFGNTIDLTTLISGVYTVVVNTNENIYSHKIVIK